MQVQLLSLILHRYIRIFRTLHQVKKELQKIDEEFQEQREGLKAKRASDEREERKQRLSVRRPPPVRGRLSCFQTAQPVTFHPCMPYCDRPESSAQTPSLHRC